MVQGGHSTRQEPTCLVSAGIRRIEQMEGDNTPLRHGSGALVLTVILCIISSKTESWDYKKGKKYNHCFQKNRRGARHQHEYRGSRSNSVAPLPAKEGICSSPTLRHPNYQTPLATASKEGIGPAA